MSDGQPDGLVPLPRLPPRSKARLALGNSPSGSSTPVFHSTHSSRDDVVHIHIDDHDSVVDEGKIVDIHNNDGRLVESANLSPPLSSPSSASSVSSLQVRSSPEIPSPAEWKFPTSVPVHSSSPDLASKRSSIQSTFVPLSPEIDPSGPVPKRPASSGVYTPASFPGPSGSARRLSTPSTNKVEPNDAVRPPLSTSGSSSFFARSRSYLAYINPSSYLGPSSVDTSQAPSALASDLPSAQPAALGKGSISPSGVYTPVSYHEQQIRIASRNLTDPAVGSAFGGPAGFPLLSPRIISPSRGSISTSPSDPIGSGFFSQTDQGPLDYRARASSVESSLSVEESPLRVKKKTSNIARKPLPATLHADKEGEPAVDSGPEISSVQNELASSSVPSPPSSDSSKPVHLGGSQITESKPVVELTATSEIPPVVLPSHPDPLEGVGMSLLPNKEMRPMEVDRPTEEMVVGRVW
ncbi:hypothetical protein [Phaffia rhodozyma]|uniref:Uncharacterized protein n=1 Tax=Phaffia rhodozyma TaxID=264483 RepID=A0A0F7SFD2_PHARH|nr:hypothetical protein [Phaffia rhodozyma]